jgi:hypothetical protein
MSSKYTYEAKEVLIENMPCWKVEIFRDGCVVKSTTLMSEGGCIKWAGEQIMRMQREDVQRTTPNLLSWVEETFGKKEGMNCQVPR